MMNNKLQCNTLKIRLCLYIILRDYTLFLIICHYSIVNNEQPIISFYKTWTPPNKNYVFQNINYLQRHYMKSLIKLCVYTDIKAYSIYKSCSTTT